VTFEQAWKNRVEADFDGIPVTFISREDLIASKSRLGRPQDLIDVELLSHGEPSLRTSGSEEGSWKSAAR